MSIGNLNSIFLNLDMQLLKDDTVNNMKSSQWYLGRCLNNNQVELSENNLILLFYEFLKMCLMSI